MLSQYYRYGVDGLKIQTFHLLTNLIRRLVAITCESITSLGQLLKTHKLVSYFANSSFVGLMNIIYCLYSLINTNLLSTCMLLMWTKLYLLYQPYIVFVHPILVHVFKSRPRPMLVKNCSLTVFCNCAQLVGAIQVIQIRFLLVCS